MEEDNDTAEGKDGQDCGVPALRLSPLLQISVFVLAFLSAAHQLRDSQSVPEGKRRRQGLFVHQYFIPGWHFSSIFPTPSHSPSWPQARQRAAALRDEAVRKISFIGWFVDGWGKIDPRQMGEDNRQMSERKDWSLGFGTKMRFFFGGLAQSLSSLSTLEIIWTRISVIRWVIMCTLEAKHVAYFLSKSRRSQTNFQASHRSILTMAEKFYTRIHKLQEDVLLETSAAKLLHLKQTVSPVRAEENYLELSLNMFICYIRSCTENMAAECFLETTSLLLNAWNSKAGLALFWLVSCSCTSLLTVMSHSWSQVQFLSSQQRGHR